MQESTLKNIDLIYRSLLALSACDDDHATEKNGVGYNGRDSTFGNSLANQVREGKALTPRQLAAAFKMLGTYRVQLERSGIKLPRDLPREIAITQPTQKQDTVISVRLVSDRLMVKSPYNAERVAKFHDLKGKWDGAFKEWSFPITALPALMEMNIMVHQSIIDRYAELKGDGKLPSFKPVAPAGQTIRPAMDFAHPPKMAHKFDEQMIVDAKALYSSVCRRIGFTEMKHQSEYVDFAIRNGGRVICALDVGLGKQQPVDTSVMTPAGWMKIGDLKVGHRVIGSNGKATAVTGVFPQGIKPSYCLTFSDGSSVEAGDEHLWTILSRTDSLHLRPITLTTKQMRGRTKQVGHSKLYLPILSAPIEFSCRDLLPIPPYTLGQLIANGSMSNGASALTVNSADWAEIKERISEEGVSIGAINQYGNTTRTRIPGIKTVIADMELGVKSGTKFIPVAYMHASPPDRISLLHGLMDGDGSISLGHNRITYCSTSKVLACQVQELVECLGGIASVKTYDRSQDNKPIEYSVRIRLPKSIPPFSTARKLDRFTPSLRTEPIRTVVSIEYVRDVESVCIRVDAEDQLYVTEHAILTHNTISNLIPAAVYAKKFGAEVWVIAPISLHDNWRREAKLVGLDVKMISWAKIPTAPHYPFVLICDEVHYCQHYTIKYVKDDNGKPLLDANNKQVKKIAPRRTGGMLGLAESSYCVAWLGLTGTPVPNGRPAGLYPLLRASKHWLATDKRAYEKTFCLAGPTRWSKWDNSGVADEKILMKLFEFTNDVVFRRKKNECMDLPILSRNMRPITMSASAAKLYQETVDRLRSDWMAKIKRGEISSNNEALVSLGHLLHAVSVAKVETTTELVNELLDHGNQIIVAFQFKESIDAVQRA